MDLWSIFTNNFLDIIKNNEYYNKLFNFLYSYENNILLYGAYGFPTDLFIDILLKKKFNCQILYKNEYTSDKDIIYKYNQNSINKYFR